MTKVKICGLKTYQDIEIVNKITPNYIGFVFAPSKRQISLEQAGRLKYILSPKIQAVGVFVNESIESILRYEKAKVIDVIQLHGDEDVAYVKSLKQLAALPIIKAFRLKEAPSIKRGLELGQYELMQSELVDYILLDNYHGKQYGGSGNRFNWKLLDEVDRPYFLAGGVGSDNIREALAYKPYAVDVSSKVETDRCKDEEKIRVLIEQIRKSK